MYETTYRCEKWGCATFSKSNRSPGIGKNGGIYIKKNTRKTKQNPCSVFKCNSLFGHFVLCSLESTKCTTYLHTKLNEVRCKTCKKNIYLLSFDISSKIHFHVEWNGVCVYLSSVEFFSFLSFFFLCASRNELYRNVEAGRTIPNAKGLGNS